MSVEVLQGKRTHEARHDLESFYWLLLFIILRHTKHSLSSMPQTFSNIFGNAVDGLDDFKRRKQSHLGYDTPLSIPGNDGMTYILKEFHALCKQNCTPGGAPISRPGMTHRDVLDIFDRALTMQWPTENDGPRPWGVPGNVLHTEAMKESINQDKTKGTFSRTTHQGNALFEGRPAQSPADPTATHASNEEDDRAQDSGTADNSDIGDETLFIAESSGEDVPSDVEDMRPNAPDAPQGLALLDVNEILEAIAQGPLARQDARQGTRDSGTDSAGQPSRNGVDTSQDPVPQFVDQAPHDSTAPDPPSHIDDREDVQESTAGPSWPARQIKPPPKTRRAPAKSRARTTRQVAETWPASNADGAGTQPGHRYNLRSSSRTTESGQTRMTRSQTKAASQQREAGTRDSSMGKRSRATRDDADDVEDGTGGQSSKRQRTLSQPRGRMATRSGKK